MVELGTRVMSPETRRANVGGRFFVDNDLIKDATKDWSGKEFKPQTAVVEALDLNSGQSIALKFYDLVNGAANESELRDNMVVVSREAFILNNLRHKNIVSTFGLYVVKTESRGKLLAMAMPWLKKVEPGKLTRDQKVGVIKSIAEALDYAHSKEVIHRDVKPSNIMLDQRGTPKLVDFDIALVREFKLRASWSRDIRAAGNRHYVAPELFSGDILPESDQYSLSRTAKEFLTGNVNIKDKPCGMSNETWEVLLKAANWDPEFRFESCTSFAQALTEAVGKTS
jgi:serine/threonine-protein kinase